MLHELQGFQLWDSRLSRCYYWCIKTVQLCYMSLLLYCGYINYLWYKNLLHCIHDTGGFYSHNDAINWWVYSGIIIEIHNLPLDYNEVYLKDAERDKKISATYSFINLFTLYVWSTCWEINLALKYHTSCNYNPRS